MKFLLILLVLIPLTAKAQAQQEQPLILSLPEGQAALNISATELREVEQDLLVGTLRFEKESTEPADVQNAVNTAMASALDEAAQYNEVKASTQSYNIHQYDRNGGKRNLPRDMAWKGSQTLLLKSKNADQLLELAGKLQGQGFLISGLNYTLSPELSAQITDDMLEAALEKLQTRAERAAKTLGKSNAELREVNVQGQNAPRAVYTRSHMMKADMALESMAAPVASAGEQTMTLTVSAKALLKP